MQKTAIPTATVDEREIISSIALSQITNCSLEGLHELYSRAGSASAVLEYRNNIQDLLPDATPRLIEAFKHTDLYIKKAEQEYQWDLKGHIQAIPMNDERYPQRLRECVDAPIVIYYRGNADLNSKRVVSVIGTRQCTTYGSDFIRNFTRDLKNLCPDVLIVSGLAYGVDINAHREALRNGYPTIGVLAHGLDQIYPRVHRDTAIEMLSNGGLLTEYMMGTPGDKRNFVQRNRIVAGMCDACVLVESAEKGGGLITIGIANDYDRDCFAVPGTVTAPYSKGCNNAIRDNKAHLITSAEDMVKIMGWADDKILVKAKEQGIERRIFPDFTENEQKVVNLLMECGDMQSNILSVRTGIAIGPLSSVLFTLEMKGVVRSMAGGTYHLLA